MQFLATNTLGIDVGTELVSLDRYLDGFNYGKCGGLLLGDSHLLYDGKILGSDEGINLGSTDVKYLAQYLEM